MLNGALNKHEDARVGPEHWSVASKKARNKNEQF